MLQVEVAFADRDQLGEGPSWDIDEENHAHRSHC